MLISRVEFHIRATNHDLGKWEVNNTDDIIEYLQHNLVSFPLDLSLERTVYVRDEYSVSEIPVKTTSVEFYAVKKLTSWADVISDLAGKVPVKLELLRAYVLKQNKNAPLLFYEKDKIGDGQPLYVCKPFDKLDIVTDDKLKQRLPANTGKIPPVLQNFLKETTEQIK